MEEIVVSKELVEVVMESFFRVLKRMDEQAEGEMFHFVEDDVTKAVCRELGVDT